jgi:hypothetical protein
MTILVHLIIDCSFTASSQHIDVIVHPEEDLPQEDLPLILIRHGIANTQSGKYMLINPAPDSRDLSFH